VNNIFPASVLVSEHSPDAIGLPAGLDGGAYLHEDQSIVILVRVEYVTERPLDRVATPEYR